MHYPSAGASIVTMGAPLADLPWAHYRVRLQLRVRKWFCGNRRGHRRIFTERLPTVAAPWAWRTLRLAHRLGALGVALGGTAGVQLGHQWDLVVSRNTLLRLLGSAAARFAHTPGARGRRFRPAETAHLWHDPGGPGAPEARGTPAGSYR